MDPTTGLAVNLPAEVLPKAVGEGLTLGLLTAKLGSYLLTAQLSALEEEGKLHILSSPSISTVDNHKAVIESGAEVPYQTKDKDFSFYIAYKKATLLLEVTPHVIDGTLLKLNIRTHKDEVDFTNEVEGNPTILTKRAQTNLILYNGQTTVIGGLSKNTKSHNERGVPGAMRVPYLGNLFKKDSRTHDLEDLLIFITPYILPQKVAERQNGPGGTKENKATNK